MHSLTYDELAKLNPCDLTARKALFTNAERLDARQALAAGVSVSDLLWVAGRMGLTDQCVTFAIRCAEAVAHLNPDPRVQAAINAAKACRADPTVRAYTYARAAADAAAAAGAAGAAAAAAAYAAYAADAADAAADAADAAADAADAAYAAYAADADAADAAAAAGAAGAYAARAADDVTEIFLDVFGNSADYGNPAT